ncbi:hypothetical protein PsorP6_011041 [Peronosclerospora sorghi]|uniref:Uncharacterized protein n=1 Tax=Peronosclerospora sorghi TaxID=230839 RepID=A0ACC0VUK4_9STRA|nr:hypothetical protein PsorP6_011041 [Peronosclerospora sorghi]
MKSSTSCLGCAAIALLTVSLPAVAQQPGTNFPEDHPSLPSQVCRKGPNGSVQCVTEASSIVLDVGRRQINAVGTTNSCYADGKWNTATCSTPQSCAQTCGVEGAAYETNHSITTRGNELNLKLKSLSKLSARVYMLDASGTKYKQFQLLNQEFTFDVDMSLLPCGSNGALYFVKMDADGGTARFPTNTAGAKYGTGYCDAQSPKTIRFVNGEANLNNSLGSTCSEMDIWEANSMATVYTTHACSIKGQQMCLTNEECGSTKETEYKGWCDQKGCSYNPFRMGNPTFYGRGKEFDIDTTRPFTVVTQFVTRDNTTTGELVEIRRLYKQDNRVIGNPYTTWRGLNVSNSITDATCEATTSYFHKHPYKMGNLAVLGKEMIGGMTLTFSIWVDTAKNMSWLDSYETGEDPKLPGARGGPCQNPGGDPASVLANYPNTAAKFSNIRSGDFGTTY